MARASLAAGATAEPLRSSTRILLPAPFMRAIVRPASGWRQVNSLFPLSGARRRGPARRPVDRSRAETRQGLAQLPVFDRGRGAARCGLRLGAWARGRAAPFLQWRQRTLPEGDLVDAAPAQMGVDSGEDDRA